MEQSAQQPTLTPAEIVRAITVPLFLIVLGALFLFDYSGGPAVRKTWPVLLIVWGGAWALMHSFNRQDR